MTRQPPSPVSLAPHRHVRVQEAAFSIDDELAALQGDDTRIGAIACFVGTVRDMNEGSGVNTLTLEHYPGMTEKALDEICGDAFARWNLHGARVVHRVGPMAPLEVIVLVAVSSAHRGEAFAACEFIMDYLKTRAPFWKQEQTPDGPRWVSARTSDEDAASRWQNTSGSD